MRRKNGVIYILLSGSIGYLFYSFLFTDVRYGMMGHHYGYYEGYSNFHYYTNLMLIFAAYVVITFCLVILLSKRSQGNNNAITILNERLSHGEISIEEYQTIKKELL